MTMVSVVVIIVITVITMVTMAPPVTTTLVTTAATDGNASLSSMPGVHDHAGRQGRGVEQNDRRAFHLDERLMCLVKAWKG